MEETERTRSSDALLRLDKHHQMQTQALDREIMSHFVELDEQQWEKKVLLANQETNRLKELDDEHKQEMKAHAERLQRKLFVSHCLSPNAWFFHSYKTTSRPVFTALATPRKIRERGDRASRRDLTRPALRHAAATWPRRPKQPPLVRQALQHCFKF